MPNTPAQVREGMTGVCANEKVSAEELDQICEITREQLRSYRSSSGTSDGRSRCCKRLLSGLCIHVRGSDGRRSSDRGNAKETGVSVCCTVCTGKCENGTGNRDASRRIKRYGMYSPAGTTIEGVRILEQNGFRSAVFEALNGAAEKGKKM